MEMNTSIPAQGIPNPQTQQPQIQHQDAGMFNSPAQQPQQGYTGTVDVQGTPVKVVGGIVEFDGQKYFVSHDGDMVIDKDRNLIGYIDNGEFKPMDKEHLSILKQKGYLE